MLGPRSRWAGIQYGSQGFAQLLQSLLGAGLKVLSGDVAQGSLQIDQRVGGLKSDQHGRYDTDTQGQAEISPYRCQVGHLKRGQRCHSLAQGADPWPMGWPRVLQQLLEGTGCPQF